MKIFLSFAACLINIVFGCVSAFADGRPHFFVIVVDDLGRDWVSCYQGAGDTPAIDTLAAEGLRYENAWAMPVGTTSRVSLITGKYPNQHGWNPLQERPVVSAPGASDLGGLTLADVLGRAGYRTAVAGRWWLDDLHRHPSAAERLGFQQSALVGHQRDAHSQPPLVMNGIAKVAPDPHSAALRFAQEFVGKQTEEPFFLLFNLAPPPKRSSRPEESIESASGMRQWAQTADRMIGQLMAHLDRTGRAEETLVLVLGDNGSPCGGELDGQPYLPGKGRATDAGAHVPWLVRAPFLNTRSGSTRDLVDVTDVFPSFLELAGIPVPENGNAVGRSIIPGLKGSEDPFDKRSWIFAQQGETHLIRDWHHLVDSTGRFHDLEVDPLEQAKVSVQDKQAPHREERLRMILGRLVSPPVAAPEEAAP